MVKHEPSVERLEVHLEGHHIVYYKEGEHENAKTVGKEKSTKLIAYFSANQKYPNAGHFCYVDFPKYFLWDKSGRLWKPRAKYKVCNITHHWYDFSNARERVVGRVYNISPREGERYFLRTLLLHKSRATSFSDISFQEGVQHHTFPDTCCALGLLSDDVEWVRCMEDAFSSHFDRITDIFSIIMAFFEPSNPLRIWERTKNLIIPDFRKRNAGLVVNDGLVADYVLNQIQNLLIEVSPALSLKSLNLPTPAERSYHIEADVQEQPLDRKNIVSIALNSEKFNKDQEEVLNTIVGEILSGVTADNLHAPVERPFNHQSACFRGYFLDAPGGTGKTLPFAQYKQFLRHASIALLPSLLLLWQYHC